MLGWLESCPYIFGTRLEEPTQKAMVMETATELLRPCLFSSIFDKTCFSWKSLNERLCFRQQFLVTNLMSDVIS